MQFCSGGWHLSSWSQSKRPCMHMDWLLIKTLNNRLRGTCFTHVCLTKFQGELTTSVQLHWEMTPISLVHVPFPFAHFNLYPLTIIYHNHEYNSSSESCEPIWRITEPESGLGENPDTGGIRSGIYSNNPGKSTLRKGKMMEQMIMNLWCLMVMNQQSYNSCTVISFCR